jgi:hypothetical protein
MPFIDDEPPSNLPRGIGMRRWPVNQHELRRRLEPFKFDVAIDLMESTDSRPLP